MMPPAALIERLRTARHLVVLTGAGVSQESGIPTFRDRQTGLWSRFDAAELATPEAFHRDPPLVWGCTSGAAGRSVAPSRMRPITRSRYSRAKCRSSRS